MDGTTEPIIAVIGHPIAGNPTQFAIEMALRSLDLDWRVLSFDVDPADIGVALDGFAVTGFAGVIIDPSVGNEAATWYGNQLQQQSDADKTSDLYETWDDDDEAREAKESETPSEPDRSLLHDENQAARIDCLYRDEKKRIVGSHEQQAWVAEIILQHCGGSSEQEQDSTREHRIWIGEQLDGLPLDRGTFSDDPISAPPDPEQVSAADLIVIADESTALEAEEWPADDGSKLIIDFTSGHADQPTLQRLGYRVVTEMERRIGTIQRCLQRWTGEQVSTDVIHDAIEEYLGV